MCSALVTDVYFFFPKFDHLFSGYLKKFLNAKPKVRCIISPRVGTR